jgi:hypothetical protein
LNTGNENQTSLHKKEFTNGIVNELKSKIQNFKNKKSNEKDNRTNELDIEVSKDMLSKFRKADGNFINLTAQNSNSQLNNKESDLKVVGSLPQTTHNKSGSISAGGKKLDTLLKEINFSSNENHNVKSNISQLNQSSNSLLGTEENKYNRISDTKENQENFKNIVNNRPTKSFLISGSENRNTSEDK